MRFRHHVALVTGASSGVGRAMAVGLAAEGATVCLVGRDAGRLDRTAGEAGEAGGEARPYLADVTRDGDVEALGASLARDFGRLDILVHSAGIIAMGRVRDSPVGGFDDQYRVNVRAPYAVTQRLLPLLAAAQGQVVFINSSAGMNARGGVGQYAATKYALRAVADSLRDEVNGDGIRVLSVFLGRTATPMQEAILRSEGRAYDPERLIQPADIVAMVLAALTLPRTAEVTDLSIRPMRKL
jgi:NAD(P)-dependent dehydrogenase (short-subunit alcohol dehydrogenase family)